jgi:tetratricopeptide (TPR) repeat protein
MGASDSGRGGDRDAWEPTPAEQLLVEAEKLDRAGKLAEAREKLLEVIKLDPKMTLAYLALGVTARRQGDFEGSVDACSKGLSIDPQDSELYLRRGIAWFHLGLYGIALEDFEDAAGIAYDDPRPELWRGLTLIELDRPLEAINAYASSIRRDRTYMLAYLNRGLAYLDTSEPRKAEFDFNQAIRHDPRDVRAWFNRGVAQARQGRFADAANSYSEALKRDPKHEPSRRNMESVRGKVNQESPRIP